MIIPADTIRVFDRYSHRKFYITRFSYEHILELIKFYHSNINQLPDNESVEVLEKGDDEVHRIEIPVNHIVFN